MGKIADLGIGKAENQSVSQSAIAAQGWQPIETAPKDGTPFLGALAFKYTGTVNLDIIQRDSIRDSWWSYSFQEYEEESLFTITHWQPLPAPPAPRTEALEPSGENPAPVHPFARVTHQGAK